MDSSHKPRRLDDDTAVYLQQIEAQLAELNASVGQFHEDNRQHDDRVILIDNVLLEIKTRTASAACDRRTNYLVEQICDCCSFLQLIEVTQRLSPYAVFLARNRYSSHILQTIIARCCYAVKNHSFRAPVSISTCDASANVRARAELDGKPGPDSSEEAVEYEPGGFENCEEALALDTMLRLCCSLLQLPTPDPELFGRAHHEEAFGDGSRQEQESNCAWLCSDMNASHVVRAAFCLLAGVPVVSQKKGKGSKHQHSVALSKPLESLQDSSSGHFYIDSAHAFSVPTAFHDRMKVAVHNLVELPSADLQSLIADTSGCAVLNLLIRILANPAILPPPPAVMDSSSTTTATATATGACATTDAVSLMSGCQLARALCDKALAWNPLLPAAATATASMEECPIFYAMAGDKSGSYFLDALLECCELDYFLRLVPCTVLAVLKTPQLPISSSSSSSTLSLERDTLAGPGCSAVRIKVEENSRASVSTSGSISTVPDSASSISMVHEYAQHSVSNFVVQSILRRLCSALLDLESAQIISADQKQEELRDKAKEQRQQVEALAEILLRELIGENRVARVVRTSVGKTEDKPAAASAVIDTDSDPLALLFKKNRMGVAFWLLEVSKRCTFNYSLPRPGTTIFLTSVKEERDTTASTAGNVIVKMTSETERDGKVEGARKSAKAKRSKREVPESVGLGIVDCWVATHFAARQSVAVASASATSARVEKGEKDSKQEREGGAAGGFDASAERFAEVLSYAFAPPSAVAAVGGGGLTRDEPKKFRKKKNAFPGTKVVGSSYEDVPVGGPEQLQTATAVSDSDVAVAVGGLAGVGGVSMSAQLLYARMLGSLLDSPSTAVSSLASKALALVFTREDVSAYVAQYTNAVSTHKSHTAAADAGAEVAASDKTNPSQGMTFQYAPAAWNILTSGAVSRAVLDTFLRKFAGNMSSITPSSTSASSSNNATKEFKAVMSVLVSLAAPLSVHYVGIYILRNAFESFSGTLKSTGATGGTGGAGINGILKNKEKWLQSLTKDKDFVDRRLWHSKEGRASAQLLNVELYVRSADEWRDSVRRQIKAASMLHEIDHPSSVPPLSSSSQTAAVPVSGGDFAPSEAKDRAVGKQNRRKHSAEPVRAVAAVVAAATGVRVSLEHKAPDEDFSLPIDASEGSRGAGRDLAQQEEEEEEDEGEGDSSNKRKGRKRKRERKRGKTDQGFDSVQHQEESMKEIVGTIEKSRHKVRNEDLMGVLLSKKHRMASKAGCDKGMRSATTAHQVIAAPQQTAAAHPVSSSATSCMGASVAGSVPLLSDRGDIEIGVDGEEEGEGAHGRDGAGGEGKKKRKRRRRQKKQP